MMHFPDIGGKKDTASNGGTQAYFCISFLTSQVSESNEHVVDHSLKMKKHKELSNYFDGLFKNSA